MKLDKQKTARLKKRVSEISDKSTAKVKYQKQIVSQLMVQKQKLAQEVQHKTVAAHDAQSKLQQAKKQLRQIKAEAAVVRKKQQAQVATVPEPILHRRHAPAGQFTVMAEKIKKPSAVKNGKALSAQQPTTSSPPTVKKAANEAAVMGMKSTPVHEQLKKAVRTAPNESWERPKEVVQTSSPKPPTAVAKPADHKELVKKMLARFKQIATKSSAEPLAAASGASEAPKAASPDILKVAAAATVHVNDATVRSSERALAAKPMSRKRPAQPAHAKQMRAMTKRRSPVLLSQAVVVQSRFKNLEKDYVYAKHSQFPAQLKQLLLTKYKWKMQKYVKRHPELRKEFATKHPELANASQVPTAGRDAKDIAASAHASNTQGQANAVSKKAPAMNNNVKNTPIKKTAAEIQREKRQRELDKERITLLARYEKTRSEYKYATQTDGVPAELRKELRSQLLAMKPQYKKYSEALARERSLRLLKAAQTPAYKTVSSKKSTAPPHQDEKVAVKRMAPTQLSQAAASEQYKKLKVDYEYAKTNPEIPDSLKQPLLAQYTSKLHQYERHHPEVLKMKKMKKMHPAPVTLVTAAAAPVQHTASVAVSKRVETLRAQYEYATKTAGFPAALRKKMAEELNKLEAE